MTPASVFGGGERGPEAPKKVVGGGGERSKHGQRRAPAKTPTAPALRGQGGAKGPGGDGLPTPQWLAAAARGLRHLCCGSCRKFALSRLAAPHLA